MNVSEPEADTEYSRGSAGPEARGRALAGASGVTGTGVLAGALVAGVALLVAEFLPLFEVHSSGRYAPVTTVQAGSHHAYALIPIAVLAGALAMTRRRSAARLVAVALVVLGVAALVIALGRDLPDARATGIERASGTYVAAAATPRAALYLETAGGVILLLTGATGVLLAPPPAGTARTLPAPRRSAS